ncbi:glycosyltransferase family 4 protein [Halobacterium litoreum]|uniref:Glycosyltransferase family 4 protein n=1 Tax=Halobacterium litoreum TaxID=2039234 RepID=A0ABD5NBH6_9EURY
MRVLNLVPNAQSRFFKQQVDVLADRGVSETTLTVPGRREYDDGDTTARTPLDYARFVPSVLKHSFGDYDLVHANYGLTAPHAVVQPNLPVVLSLWGTDLMGEYGWVSKLCARFADAVVVMSPAMAAELDGDCRVIPHGVNLDRFRPEPQAAARAALDWDADARHVLFPYPRERTVKDYPRADQVVDRVRDRIDDVALHTPTGVPHEEMPTYMNAADALLVTSRREGSPNAVKEALACNLPVVSTDVGDVATRLDGVTHSRVCETDGELVDALATVLRAGERSNGREAAREVSVERTSQRLHDCYRDVLAGR